MAEFEVAEAQFTFRTAILRAIVGCSSKNQTPSSTDRSRTSAMFLPWYFTSRVSWL